MEEPPSKEEQEGGRRQVHQQQSQVDAAHRLAEDRHDPGIGRVGPGKLHVVGQAVGRNALEDQLPGVGVLPLVALQRHVHEAQADGRREQKDQEESGPVPAGRFQGSARGSMSALTTFFAATSSTAWLARARP